MGASRSNQGTDRRVQQQPNYFEHSVAQSQFPHWDRGSEEIKQYVKQCESHGERTHRPCQPRSRTSAHPTDSSPLFACSFRHNSTLQHRRLSSVTTNVTKQKIQDELPRIPKRRSAQNFYSAHWCENSLGGCSFSWFRGGPARAMDHLGE